MSAVAGLSCLVSLPVSASDIVTKFNLDTDFTSFKKTAGTSTASRRNRIKIGLEDDRGEEPSSIVRTSSIPGCSRTTYKERISLILGTRSNCIGGSLTSAERAFLDFELEGFRKESVANFALRADPRRFKRLPRNATAGVRVPLTSSADIGVQYTFGMPGDESPFHFSDTGLPDDQLVGHRATFSVGLKM